MTLQNDLEEVADARRREEHEAVKSVLSTYHGRAFMWMLLMKAGGHGDSFCGEFPLTMAHSEGKRTLCIWGENWVFTAAPETYIIMRQEAVERERRHASELGLAYGNEEEED